MCDRKCSIYYICTERENLGFRQLLLRLRVNTVFVSYLLFNIQYPSQVRQVEITTRSRISHFQSIWIKKHRTSKFWSFNSIYMLSFQCVTFIQDVSQGRPIFSAHISGVTRSLEHSDWPQWSPLHDQQQVSLLNHGEKGGNQRKNVLLSFVLNELKMNNICYIIVYSTPSYFHW